MTRPSTSLLRRIEVKTWMPGTRPGMTTGGWQSIARCGYRWRSHPDRLLRLQRADVERQAGDQEKTDEIDRIGLRRRDRPTRKTSDDGCWTGFVFHVEVLLETARNWKRQCNQGAAGSLRSRNSASRAERLSAEETISTRLPIASINRPNARGAAACAIRAGAPIMPRR